MSKGKQERNWRELIERAGRWMWAVAECVWRDLKAWTRLQWQLAQIERRIRALTEDRDEALQDLGRAVVSRLQAGRLGDSELASRCTTVQVLEKEIEVQRQEKVRLRAKPVPVPSEVAPSVEEGTQPALLTLGGSESSAGEGVS